MKLFIPLLLLCILSACVQSAKADTGGNGKDNKKSVDGPVQGYVTDAVTKKPVTGVTVSVSSKKNQQGKEVQSDDCGYFHFSKVPPGEVTLMFEKKGYKVSKRDVSAKEGGVAKVSVAVEPLDEDGGNESWHPLLKLFD